MARRDKKVSEGPSEEREAQGVQSVEIGFRILTALAEFDRAAPLREIAEAVGLTASTTHRYLVSLVRAGILVQDRRGGNYDLGPNVLQMGLAAVRRLDEHGLAGETLSELHEAIGHTAGLIVWTKRGPTIIRWKEADTAVTVNARPGHTLPTTLSASGRVFAAFLPSKRVDSVIADELAGFAIGSRNLPRLTRTEFEERLREVRTSYVSVVRGELLPGIDALSAPVFDHDGDVRFALAIWGSDAWLDVGVGGAAYRALVDAAESLSHKLGFRSNFPRPKAATVSIEGDRSTAKQSGTVD